MNDEYIDTTNKTNKINNSSNDELFPFKFRRNLIQKRNSWSNEETKYNEGIVILGIISAKRCHLI